MYYTLSRPPDGRAILLDLDRDAPAGHTAHPIGRAAESAVHALFALLGILRSCGNDDDPFARHNDRSLRKTDSAFVLSGLPASAIVYTLIEYCTIFGPIDRPNAHQCQWHGKPVPSAKTTCPGGQQRRDQPGKSFSNQTHDCPPRRAGTTGGPGLPDPGGRAPAAPARERR